MRLVREQGSEDRRHGHAADEQYASPGTGRGRNQRAPGPLRRAVGVGQNANLAHVSNLVVAASGEASQPRCDVPATGSGHEMPGSEPSRNL